MAAYQGKPYSFLIQFVAPSSSAVILGLVASNLTLSTVRPGGTSFAVRTVATSDLLDLGSGYYILRLPALETALLGLLVYQVAAPGAATVTGSLQVEPQPVGLLASPATCIVTGNVVQLGGAFTEPTEVIFKPMHLPSQVAGTSLISAKAVQTWTDAVGNFSVTLLRGAVVMVDVADCGLKGQFLVPNAGSADLLTLVPV